MTIRFNWGMLSPLLPATAAILLLMTACNDTPGERVTNETGDPTNVRVWHDTEHGAVCWIYKAGYAGGISCLPDSEVTP